MVRCRISAMVTVIKPGVRACRVESGGEVGGLGERMVFAADLPGLSSVEAGAAFSFTGDPASFKLAAEARRMRLAHLFDPQAALGTSDVDPLPHQLRAVYEEMLPRHPLR